MGAAADVTEKDKLNTSKSTAGIRRKDQPSLSKIPPGVTDTHSTLPPRPTSSQGLGSDGKWRTVLFLTGQFLINLPIGVPTFYGNLSTYINSYFRYCPQMDAGVQVSPVWMLPTFLVAGTVGFMTVDWITNTFGHFRSLVIASVGFDSVLALTFFTVQHSVGLTLAVFMLMGGYFSGLTMMLNLVYSAKVMPQRPGMASTIAMSAFAPGTFIINFLITVFINPENYPPDVRSTTAAYFSQVSLLQRVPMVFVVLASFSACFHVLGLLLIYTTRGVIQTTQSSHINQLDADSKKFDQGFPDTTSHSKKVVTKSDISNGIGSFIDQSNSNRNLATELSSMKNVNYLQDDTTLMQEKAIALNEETETPRAGDNITPLRALATPSFLPLWVSICVMTHAYLLTNDYYKHFGQLWIKDDIFLTSTGSSAAVTSSVVRVLLGVLVDKRGIKKTLTLVLSLNSVLMAFWYVTPRASKWLYFFWFQALASTASTLFTLFPIAVMRLYGTRHYAIIYGLLMSGNVLTNLLSPVVMPVLLTRLGWSVLMSLESVGSLVALGLTLLFINPSK